LKQKLFSLDDEILKPYFKLENVLNGAFTIAEKLFGITFREVFDIDKYHQDVMERGFDAFTAIPCKYISDSPNKKTPFIKQLVHQLKNWKYSLLQSNK
jgi:hypothetical protein